MTQGDSQSGWRKDMNKNQLGASLCGCFLVLAVGVGWAQENLKRGQAELIAPDTTLLNDVEEGRALQSPAPSTDRWIGVAVGPIPENLMAHVSLPGGAGVLVEQVIPDSPAANAGLRRHDILTELDGNQLTDARSLVDGVRSTQDSSLELKWMRGGQQMSAQVTPAARKR
jgi:S1-C subfamily serine protease